MVSFNFFMYIHFQSDIIFTKTFQIGFILKDSLVYLLICIMLLIYKTTEQIHTSSFEKWSKLNLKTCRSQLVGF